MSGSISVELAPLEPKHVAGDVDDRHVQAVAETEVGDAVLARPARGRDLALGAARSEAAGNDDAGDRAQRAGQLVGRHRLGVDPDDLRLDVVPEAGVGQRFEHAHVGVVQLDVLADEGDPERPPRPADLLDEIPPLAQIGFARQSELASDVVAQPGLLQDQRHLVDRVGRRHRDDGVAVDVAEERDLLLDVVGNRAVGAAMMTSGWMPSERSSRTLCWVGLVFSSPPPISGTSVTWM